MSARGLLLSAAILAGCSAPSADEEPTGRAVAAIEGVVPVGATLRATANVNLRSAPNTSSTVLRVVPTGALVKVVNGTPSDGFYQLSYDGVVGFGHGGYYVLVSSEFSYTKPGVLVPESAGVGRVDTKVYAPGMRFPIESAPAYANSQVWGHGGYLLGRGAECDIENFSYPWSDNFCEKRDWDMPLCPAGVGHQGQDIRAASCKNRTHWAVATVDGTIISASGPGTGVAGYQVLLTGPDGTRYRYLHMSDVQVAVGQKVKRGQRLGTVSREFNGTPTTVHLHFDLLQNVSGLGLVFVPTYLSLVQSYETLLGVKPASPDAGVDAAVPVDAAPITDAAPDAEPATPDAEPASPEAAVDDAPAPSDVADEPMQAGGDPGEFKGSCAASDVRTSYRDSLVAFVLGVSLLLHTRRRSSRGEQRAVR